MTRSATYTITVKENTSGYPWPWTAYLSIPDPDGSLIEVMRADGDTPDDALQALEEERHGRAGG